MRARLSDQTKKRRGTPRMLERTGLSRLALTLHLRGTNPRLVFGGRMIPRMSCLLQTIGADGLEAESSQKVSSAPTLGVVGDHGGGRGRWSPPAGSRQPHPRAGRHGQPARTLYLG